MRGAMIIILYQMYVEMVAGSDDFSLLSGEDFDLLGNGNFLLLGE